MGKIVAVENLSLDGVMQAPGGADEDTAGGFAHGGWAHQYDDVVKGKEMGEGMAKGGVLLFGRRTYEQFYRVFPGRTDNPFSPVLDNARKYVASTTLKAPLPWKNSTLLEGDAPAAVKRLKAKTSNDIVVLGSGGLIRSLMPHNLVDEYVLLIHPLVLGSGTRLFPEDGPYCTLRLVKSVPTTTGVVIATYHAR